MRTRPLACLVVATCFVLSGCRAPGAPSATATPLFVAGEYLLHIVGARLSFDPLRPPCELSLYPLAGAAVMTRVVFAAEGQWWVGRSPAGSADTLLIAVRSLEFEEMGGIAFEGTLTGTAKDQEYTNDPASDVQFTVTGTTSSTVRGRLRVSPLSPLQHGTAEVTGTFRFEDSEGRGQPCTSVFLNLNLLSPR
jgi:hypothetical protein